MFHSVTFGEKNSWDDWHLIPTSRPVINPPQVDTKFVEIPGMDGAYDMTEWLTGRPQYKNRTGTIDFAVVNDYMSWDAAFSIISNYLHGRSMRLILEDDPEFYYKGRFSVNKWKSDKWYSVITISYILNPWKKSLYSTAEPWQWDPFDFNTGIIQDYSAYQVDGETTITLIGLREPTTAKFSATSAMTMIFNGKTYNLVEGENTFEDILLTEGNNEITFNGSGVIGIDYIGGSF